MRLPRRACQPGTTGEIDDVPERAGAGGYFSQALTLSGLASIHFLAASSGDIPSSVMYFATRFWSSLLQLKFLISR